MAIDPSISLGLNAPQVDVVGSMSNAANLAANMQKPAMMQAQTNNLNAQTQGFIADSADKVRNFTFKKWSGENIPFQTNADGSPMIDTLGQKVINMPLLQTRAESAGYSDMIPHLADMFADNTTKQISNAKTHNELNQTLFTQGNQTAGVVASYAGTLGSPDQKAVAIKAGIDRAAKIFGANSPIVTNMTQAFADPNNPTPAETQNFILGAKAAVITPLEQKNLDNTKMQLAQAQESVQNSIRSQNMNASQMVIEGQKASNISNALADGANQYESLGLTDSNKISSYTQSQINNLITTNPAWARTNQAIAQYNSMHPSETPVTITTPGVNTLLRKESTMQNAMANQYSSAAKAGSSNIPGSRVPPMNPATTNPQMPGSTVGKVKMKAPDGAEGYVPASEVQRLKTMGYTQE